MGTAGMRVAALGLVLAMLAPAADGQNARAARKQVESSMLVTGSVDIAADGGVEGHRLDRPEMLPPGVVALLEKHVPTWRFEPVMVDGRAVRARTAMSVRVGARKLEDGGFEVAIRNASFGGDRPSGIESVSMTPPKYPREALQANVTGTVYMLVRVGPDGAVVDALDEQVNLRAVGTPRQMEEAREMLAKASIAAARKWRFTVTPEAIAEGDGFAYARVPISYAFPHSPATGYGIWETYVPGPTRRASWQLEPIDPSFSPDAQVAGSLKTPGSGPRLLTPLGEG